MICYSYEPTYPSYCFSNYVDCMEDILSGNYETAENKSYIVMEYSGDDSKELDIDNGNIKKVYLVEDNTGAAF